MGKSKIIITALILATLSVVTYTIATKQPNRRIVAELPPHAEFHIVDSTLDNKTITIAISFYNDLLPSVQEAAVSRVRTSIRQSYYDSIIQPKSVHRKDFINSILQDTTIHYEYIKLY